MTITIVLLLFFTQFFAQSNISIPYKSKIDIGAVAADAHFYITGNNLKIHLTGAAIKEYIFSSPGEYLVKVKENTHPKNDCERHLPTEIAVHVSRIRMTFDSKNISFSSPIRKNTETTGIILSIPVTIETFDHLPAPLNFTPVHSAGIATAITAVLNPEKRELPEGTHTLQYALKGIVTENSYLMFDFVDANAQVQTVSLTTPIKN
jgi:hypothetical protein